MRWLLLLDPDDRSAVAGQWRRAAVLKFQNDVERLIGGVGGNGHSRLWCVGTGDFHGATVRRGFGIEPPARLQRVSVGIG